MLEAKKKQAFIFAVDDNPNEENYSKMALLLIQSILDSNPGVDIHCGVFTDRISSGVVHQIETQYPDVNVHVNIVFSEETSEGSNYFLRNYCCWYFGENVLQNYDQLIYIDIDALVLKEMDFILEPDSIIVEEVPDNIKLLEEQYTGKVQGPLYYNWWTIVTPSNKFVWELDYFNSDIIKEKQSCIEVSKRIATSNLNIIHQDIGAYYPKHKLTKASKLFHYDGFIDSGSFWRLKKLKIYKKYKLFAERILGLKNENNELFWD